MATAAALNMTERDAYRQLQRAHIEAQEELSGLRVWNKSLQQQASRAAGKLDAEIVQRLYWQRCALDLTEANERYRRAAGEWKRPEEVA